MNHLLQMNMTTSTMHPRLRQMWKKKISMMEMGIYKISSTKEIRSQAPVLLLATIRIQPLRLYSNVPMIMALLLAVEATPVKYTLTVKVLGGWRKKR